jgi:hypothetical protein
MARNQHIGEIFDEGTAVDEAMRRGWYRAVWRHRRLGLPLLISKGGQIVELDPYEAELPDGYQPNPPDRVTVVAPP